MGRARIALIAVSAASVALAGWAGLGRMAIVPPLALGGAAERHGALLVTALGLLIALERATVVRRRWAWAAPALAGGAALAIAAGLPVAVGSMLGFAAAAVLLAVAVQGAIATPRSASTLMVAGALAWGASALLGALGTDAPRVTPLLAAFLVLTIAGERHELARALRPSGRASAVLGAIVAMYLGGSALALVDLALGMRVAGAGLVGIASWLLLRDRPVAAWRAHPMSRFIRRGTLLGYVWLAAGGALWVAFDGAPAGPRYDAMLHAVFAGFVLSLVLAHGPIVIPAIVGGSFSFTPGLYAGLLLLTLSVAARVGGDLVASVALRDVGAVGIAIALIAYGIAVIGSLRTRRPATRAAVSGAGLR
jgi:hypothetical protein